MRAVFGGGRYVLNSSRAHIVFLSFYAVFQNAMPKYYQQHLLSEIDSALIIRFAYSISFNKIHSIVSEKHNFENVIRKLRCPI